MRTPLALTVIGIALLAAPARAAEYPIGTPHQRHGMEIGAVYLQPVDMDGAAGQPMRPARQADIHIEADVRALENNPNGFPAGQWIPYLRVRYEIAKKGAGKPITGDFVPMVASDGPHYGDNVKLMGPGKYTVKYQIYPPGHADNPEGRHFHRHTDRLTGVRPWFEPFTVEYEFIYAGIGKKGGY